MMSPAQRAAPHADGAAAPEPDPADLRGRASGIDRWPSVLPAVAVGIVAAGVHAGALANGFAFDDVAVVAGDPSIRTLAHLPARLMEPYWPDGFGAAVGSWRPLTTLAFALTWQVSGGAAWAFHLLGLLLHGLAAGLVVALLGRFLPAAGALAGGLVFAVHPVHVEAVANVVGLAEPLAASLALGALLVHLGGGHTYGPARTTAVVLLYGAAVLAKEGAAVVPALILLLDGLRREVTLGALGAYLRDRGALFGALAATLAVLLWVRSEVLGSALVVTAPPGMEALTEIPRIWTLAQVWGEYLRLLLFPLDLAADYSPGVLPLNFGWTPAAMAGAGAVLGLLALAWVLWRRGRGAPGQEPTLRLPAAAILWSAVSLLPVAHVFFLAPMILGERTLYLASVGPAFLAGWLVASAGPRTRMVAPAVGVAVFAGAVLSARRVPAWRDSATVVATLLDEHPESGRAWLFRARELAGVGRHALARPAFRNALFLLNSEYQASVDAASHLLASGRPESARFFLRRAWREHPEWYTAPGLLAAAELQAGDAGAAEEAARAAVALRPDNPSMHHLLAQALAARGRHDEAAAARRDALAAGYTPAWLGWTRLARDLALAGRAAQAAAVLDTASAVANTPEARRAVDETRTFVRASGTSNR